MGVSPIADHGGQTPPATQMAPPAVSLQHAVEEPQAPQGQVVQEGEGKKAWHMPWMQSSSFWQALPHAPQLRGSLATSMQLPWQQCPTDPAGSEHSESLAAEAQSAAGWQLGGCVESVQNCPAPQATPHPPQ